MTKLIDLARVLRSKNAGPLWLTVDILFDHEAAFARVLSSGVLTRERIAGRYGVSTDDVRVIPYEIVRAIKITLPRACVSGDPADTDIYGCQQHLPIAEIEIPESGPEQIRENGEGEDQPK